MFRTKHGLAVLVRRKGTIWPESGRGCHIRALTVIYRTVIYGHILASTLIYCHVRALTVSTVATLWGFGMWGFSDLLEFARAEDEVAGRDFVAERLADLRRVGGLGCWFEVGVKGLWFRGCYGALFRCGTPCRSVPRWGCRVESLESRGWVVGSGQRVQSNCNKMPALQTPD